VATTDTGATGPNGVDTADTAETADTADTADTWTGGKEQFNLDGGTLRGGAGCACNSHQQAPFAWMWPALALIGLRRRQ
jgi:uncharacterized protein (TIGR03382 family)